MNKSIGLNALLESALRAEQFMKILSIKQIIKLGARLRLSAIKCWTYLGHMKPDVGKLILHN